MDDEKIVQLYWNRDEQAIPATSEKYGAYCASIARNILGNPGDAEECVNDTYMSAWNAMPPHRPGVLSAFLGNLTRNLSLNRYKYNSADRRGGGEIPAVLDEMAELVSDPGGVEQEMDRRELVEEINAFLGKLSKDQRGIFVCRYWYFDPVYQIAARYGMTENRVSVTLNRLRGKLRSHLLERGFMV